MQKCLLCAEKILRNKEDSSALYSSRKQPKQRALSPLTCYHDINDFLAEKNSLIGERDDK